MRSPCNRLLGPARSRNCTRGCSHFSPRTTTCATSNPYRATSTAPSPHSSDGSPDTLLPPDRTFQSKATPAPPMRERELQSATVGHMAKSIYVMSPEGLVGKSAIALGLSLIHI